LAKREKFFVLAVNAFLFLVLLLIIYGTAIININRYYIGVEGDSSYYIWIAKWFSQFFSHPNILHVTNVFYPIGIDISAGWEGSILFYVGGFFNLFFSEAASYNLLILFPLVLDWIAIYFVFYKFSRRLFYSGLFSALFCTSSFFMARSLGHPPHLYFFHIPLLFYFLQPEQLARINLKRAAFLIALYALISLTSWYYFIFAVIITAVYLINFATKTGKANLKIYKTIALTYAGVLLAVVVFNFPMFKAFLFGSQYFYPYPFKMNNTPLNQEFSMHLVEYFKPSTLNIFYSNHPAWQNGNVEKSLFPGISYFILLAISLFYILRKKQGKRYFPLIIIGIIFIIFSLGYNSPLPLYRILTSLPIASTLHAPARFGIIAVFVGWLVITKSSTGFRGRFASLAIPALILFQLFETTKFDIPHQNFNDLYILKKIESSESSPVLDLPMRYSNSSTLLIPALTGRNVFSGYPQHTTFSPQLDYINQNNVFNSLGEAEKTEKDVMEELSVEETAIYLKSKYNLKDMVVNKIFSLNKKASQLLNYFNLVDENGVYAIYTIRELNSPKDAGNIKIITGRGFGKLLQGKRSVAEKSEIDILNTGKNAKKIKLHFKIEGLKKATDYFIDGKNIKGGFEITTNPGIETRLINASDKCTVTGADCITGTVSGISFKVIN